MSDDFTVDTSEVSRLSADFLQVTDNIGPFLNSAMHVTARRTRDDWRENVRGLPHAPAFPSSISYDVTVFRGFGVSLIQAEIGPDKEKRQGALGNLLEYGSVNNAPRGDGHGALQRNQADFEYGMNRAVEDAERKAGL